MVTYLDLPTTGVQSWHRGGGAVCPVAPENSRSGVIAAIAGGAHIIDVDCRQTSDGVFVAMHDTTTGRTCATNVTVSSTAYASLPLLNKPSEYGSGWGTEAIPKVIDLLTEFGGQILFTLEPKGGTGEIAALASMISSLGLQDSVYINGNTTTYTSTTVAAGCLAHQYGVTDSAGVTAAAAAGASLIELPYNVGSAVMATANSSSIHRVISAPVGTRTEEAAMTAGFNGMVVDSPKYVGRASGQYASTGTISEMVTSGKRGPGVIDTSGSLSDWLSPNAVKYRDAASFRWLMLGHVSGTPPTTGSITVKFKYTTLPTTTSQSFRARVLCPEEDGTGQDTNTRGYVLGLRGNGTLNLWSSNSTVGGATTALGTSPTGTALVNNTEYSLLFEWTATQVRLTRVDTGANTGWVTSSGSHLRGPYQYIWDTAASPAVGLVTAFEFPLVASTGSATATTSASGTAIPGSATTGTVTATVAASGTASASFTTTGSVSATAAASATVVEIENATGTASATISLTGAGMARFTESGTTDATVSATGPATASFTTTGTASATVAGSGDAQGVGTSPTRTGTVTATAAPGGTTIPVEIRTGHTDGTIELLEETFERYTATGTATATSSLSGDGLERYVALGSAIAILAASGSGSPRFTTTSDGSVTATLTGQTIAAHYVLGEILATLAADGDGLAQQLTTGDVTAVVTADGSTQASGDGVAVSDPRVALTTTSGSLVLTTSSGLLTLTLETDGA